MEKSQGYLGDLHQKTLPQLQEILERQEKILAKQKFMDTLPDNGEKVKNFVQTLRHLIADKQGSVSTVADRQGSVATVADRQGSVSTVADRQGSVSTVADRQSSVSTVNDRQGSVSTLQHSSSISPTSAESSLQQESPTRKIKSDFVRLRDRSDHNPHVHAEDLCERVHAEGETEEDQASVIQVLTQPRGQLTEDLCERVHAEGDNRSQDPTAALSDRLEGMVVSDSSQTISRQEDVGSPRGKAGGEAVFPNSYEVVMRRNAQSSARKPAFKPNSTLNVVAVKDLPEHFKQKTKISDIPTDSQPSVSTKRAGHACEIDGKKTIQTSHHKVQEESAVHPPAYNFQKVKMISVEDSIQLQRQQRLELERMQARHAADRLAERLHIKMDEYSTPTTDMDYRSTDTQGLGEVYDSDDDDPDECTD